MFWTSVNSDVSQLKLPFIKKKQLLTNDLLAEVKVFKEKAHGSKLARLVTSGHSGSQYAQCRSGDDRTFYCPSLRTLQVLSSSDLSTAKGLGCSSGVLLRCQDEDTKAIPCDILIFVEHFWNMNSLCVMVRRLPKWGAVILWLRRIQIKKSGYNYSNSCCSTGLVTIRYHDTTSGVYDMVQIDAWTPNLRSLLKPWFWAVPRIP